jgi:hypothetical protein
MLEDALPINVSKG